MMTLTKCTIVDDEGDLIAGDEAVVVVSGDSPNAIVRISEPDHEARKFRQVDRILEASIQTSGGGKTWTIQGRSEHLSDEIGTEDSRVVLKVESKGGCQGCH